MPGLGPEALFEVYPFSQDPFSTQVVHFSQPFLISKASLSRWLCLVISSAHKYAKPNHILSSRAQEIRHGPRPYSLQTLRETGQNIEGGLLEIQECVYLALPEGHGSQSRRWFCPSGAGVRSYINYLMKAGLWCFKPGIRPSIFF